MLVIKAEIWPHGEFADRSEIARIGIINRGPGRGIVDYNVVKILGRDREERIEHALVVGHVRSTGWMPLVASALVQDHAPILHQDYVDQVAELLKKG